MDKRTVGVLGGGQLGRMFGEAASRLNVAVRFLDAGEHTPAKQITAVPTGVDGPRHVDGSFADKDKIRELAEQVDVLTVEIEHVDADQLQAVLDEGLVQAVCPAPSTVRMIQDKYAQKQHLVQHGVPVVESVHIDPGSDVKADIRRIADRFGLPLMLKSRTQAYDGRGNFMLKSTDQIEAAVEALGGGSRPLYAEKWASFEREIAVMVVRGADGTVVSYPAVETVHENSICHSVYAPLRTSQPDLPERAREISERAVASFDGAGIFGVELFLMPDGAIYLNEMAPRPHNSGHYTMEACETSQFDNHLRAILGMPLGSTALKVGSAAMLNILGVADLSKDKDALAKTLAPAVRSLSVPGTTVHLYGKSGCRPGRKMGHINIVGPSDAAVRERMAPLLHELELAQTSAREGTPWNADEARERAAAASASAAKTPQDFVNPHALVGIIMGSDSDLGVMLTAAQTLKDFGVPFELTIVSAHRTPDRMREYAQSARARGVRVIIAGAGGAAHLPGMVAAQTCVPVIGVPVKGSSLDGVDSLHSIVQMPRGVPVATVAINNSMNAALLAIRMLGTGIPAYADKMERYMRDMEAGVMDKVERLALQGWDYGK